MKLNHPPATRLFAAAFLFHLMGGPAARAQQAESPPTETARAQAPDFSRGPAAAISDEAVASRRTLRVPGFEGKIILEKLKPSYRKPAPPLPPAPVPGPAESAEARAARLAAWRASAPKARQFFSLTAAAYPEGLTLLSWWGYRTDGEPETYEAWSRTDFRSLAFLGDFDVRDTRYALLPVTMTYRQWPAHRPRPVLPDFPAGSPGFRLIQGNPENAAALEAIAELHEIYRRRGAELTAQWEAWRQKSEEEAARLKANPPPVPDAVLRYRPIRSRGDLPAASTARSVPAESSATDKPGGSQASPR